MTDAGTNAGPDAPIATIDGQPRLLGGRCTVCGTHTFPRQGACPKCGAITDAAPLPLTGTLWSWTVQRIEPKPPYRSSPGAFEPFAVGYVDLGPVRVESILRGRAVDSWNFDDAVSLFVSADDLDEQGHATTFAFTATPS